MNNAVRRKIVEALARCLKASMELGKHTSRTQGMWSATEAISEVLPGNLFEEVNIRVKELLRT